MIEFRGTSKRYGAQRVLSDVALTIAAGAVTAVVGPNGAGKTTLLKIILGLVRADAGEVLFQGKSIAGGHDYRANIGYMPQVGHFPDNLSARHVLRMLSELRGAAATRDEELLDVFTLRPELDKRISAMSGGTRQKLNAVVAFLFAPGLMLLDEPTAGLDPLASSALKDKILAQRAAGRSFVLTSHNMADLDELADRVIFLLDGKVHFDGAPAALLQQTGQQTLERAFAALMKAEPVPA